MIIVDTALQRREEQDNPIRAAIIGAGFMGRAVVNQIVNSVPGMRLLAVSNRSVDKALDAYREAGVHDVKQVNTRAELEDRVAKGKYSVTDDAMLLCEAEGIEALLEVTGAVEFGARVALRAFDHGKHLILMNAEVDGTVGPILKTYADKAGVIFSGSDGDQPGVQVNLHRFVKGLGLTPLVCGNIKGLQDPYRNPTTQEGFAKKWGQNPTMVTSFADGTKISFEQAIVANATGMKVSKRGMIGRDFTGHVDELTREYDIDELKELGGIVDYVVGAKPNPGVYVLASHDDPMHRHYLKLYKLGDGPLYSFYTPYHLCHFEAPHSIARAVLFKDAVMAPIDRPRVDVVATAKIDLKSGESLDCIGGYMTYGQCENSEIVLKENLLPIGLAGDCKLIRDVPKDQVLTYDDVIVPEGRLCDRLRDEQNKRFFEV